MERISAETPFNERMGHEFRYHMAAGFLELGDVVVDAACGIGYGADILCDRGGIKYIGVDKNANAAIPSNQPEDRRFIWADLLRWSPTDSYDVWVGFETIEHLTDYSYYISLAKRARKWILLSVPVIPTKHMNPYHLHDFESGELVHLIEDDNWFLYQALGQPSEFSEIYVFKRQ
jgi:trans-aconitate methyltransferase